MIVRATRPNGLRAAARNQVSSSQRQHERILALWKRPGFVMLDIL